MRERDRGREVPGERRKDGGGREVLRRDGGEIEEGGRWCEEG